MTPVILHNIKHTSKMLMMAMMIAAETPVAGTVH